MAELSPILFLPITLFIIIGVYVALFKIGKNLQEAGQELENQKLFNAGGLVQWLIKFSIYFIIFSSVSSFLIATTDLSELTIIIIAVVGLVIGGGLYGGIKKYSSNNNQKSNIL
tara:strand:- start:370 stop:711 length:342 start_codon:yes stop_codon:yes gene_type:complete